MPIFKIQKKGQAPTKKGVSRRLPGSEVLFLSDEQLGQSLGSQDFPGWSFYGSFVHRRHDMPFDVVQLQSGQAMLQFELAQQRVGFLLWSNQANHLFIVKLLVFIPEQLDGNGLPKVEEQGSPIWKRGIAHVFKLRRFRLRQDRRRQDAIGQDFQTLVRTYYDSQNSSPAG